MASMKLTLVTFLPNLGVSRGALYHHFATEKARFEAVFVADSESTIARANRGLKATASPLEDLIQACFRWLKAVQDPVSPAILVDQGPDVLGWQRARDLESRSSLDLMR
jgi:AcrR family transcriptional regulator